MNEIYNKENKKAEELDELEQLVTFVIEAETYGVEVLKVQEIIGMTTITHVPNSLPFMKGVINLRGAVVPVIDVRLKFGMHPRDYDSYTVILIVEIKGNLVGMIVDSVSDVVDVAVKSIQITPHFSININTDYIKGIVENEKQLIIILDVDRILNAEEMLVIDKTPVA